MLRQAGCPHPTKDEVQEITIAADQQAEFERIEKEMREWRDERESELERIRRRRAERRGEDYQPMTNGNSSLMALGLDDNRPESKPEQQQAQARVAVPLPADSPSASGSGGSSPSPSPAKLKSNADGHTDPHEDGPKCLPVDTLQDVLAWEPEAETDSKSQTETDRHEMDEKFAAAMRDEGLHPNLDTDNGTSVHVGDTFGRKVSGTGNGLDVIVEGRQI